jgi:hypothetical protein
LFEQINDCKKIDNELIMNKAQHTTRGIKHWGLSGYSNILPRIKFGVTGQESSPNPQRFHTAKRCVQP